MSAIDPLEALIALGVITREQLEESKRVDPDVASTSIGRLIAAGADAGELMPALSSLTGIPVATPAQLAAAAPLDGLPPELMSALGALPAAPLGRGADGVLEVAVAEPGATQELAALGVQRFRAFLALEIHVRDILEREAPPPSPSAPAPAAAAHGPSQAPPLVLEPPGPAISIIPAGKGPPGAEPPVAEPPGAEPPVAAPQPEPMERAKPVRERYAPGARPKSVAPPPQATPELTPATMTATPAPRVTTTPGAKAPPPASPAPPLTPPKKSRAPLVIGAVAIVAVAVLGVVFGPQLRSPPAAPVDELSAKQQKELAAARAEAARGNPTNAIIHCEAVVALDPTTPRAHEAQLLHAEQQVVNGDRLRGIDELKKLVDRLGATDPVRKRAQESLARLQPPPIDASGHAPDADAAGDAAAP